MKRFLLAILLVLWQLPALAALTIEITGGNFANVFDELLIGQRKRFPFTSFKEI